MRSCISGLPVAIALIATTAFTTVPLNASPVEPAFERPGLFATIFGTMPAVGDTTSGLPANVASDLSRRITRIDRVRERLAHESGFLRSADEGTLLLLFNRNEGKNELLRGYAPSFAGKEPPPNMFAKLDVAVDGLWSEITRLAPTYGPPSGHPLMESVAKAVERRLRVAVPKATYVGGMLHEKEWRVRLSALGLPESRAMAGVVFYRVPDQPWIVCREFEIQQKYFKRTEAEFPADIALGSLRLQGSV